MAIVFVWNNNKLGAHSYPGHASMSINDRFKLSNNSAYVSWWGGAAMDGDYKNCSTIVSRVLRAGSSKGSAWRRHSHIWTPLKVKRLAYSMGGKDISWKEFLRTYYSSVVSKDELLQLHKLKKRTSGHGTCHVAARFENGLDTGMTSIFIKGQCIGETREGSTVFRRT